MDLANAMLSAEQRRLAAHRRRAGLIVAAVVALAALLLAPDNMSPRAARLMALLAATFVLWLSEALPVGIVALGAAAAGAVLGVAEPAAMFAPFAHPTVWLLLAALLLGEVAQWRQLDRAFALAFFSRRRTELRDLLLRATLATFALSAWLPNRAAVALLAHVVKGQDPRFGARFQRLGLSSAAFAAALGGMVLPIGAPANLIALGALAQYDGREVPLLAWSLVAAPLAALLLAGWLLASRLVLGPDGRAQVHGDQRAFAPALGKRQPRPPTTQMLRLAELPQLAAGLDRGQFAIAAVGLATLLLWLLPGLATLIGAEPWASELRAALPAGPVALLLLALLFVLPAARRPAAEDAHGAELEPGGEPVATWQAAQRIDWETILLVGAALALGHQSIDTGLSHWLGEAATRALRIEGEAGLTWLLTALALAVTQVTSSAVTAAICAPLAVVAAQQLGVSPVAPCLAVGMASSCGLLLPMSDECNQLIFATGSFRRGQLARRGLLGLLAVGLAIPPVTLVACRLLQL